MSWKYVYADCETGEYKMRQIERLENLIPAGKSYSIEQVTQDGFLLNTYEKTMFRSSCIRKEGR